MTTQSRAPGLQDAINKAGSTVALAKVLGITKGAVSQWKKPGAVVPATHCPSIERLYGVKSEELNPDVDWQFIRNNSFDSKPT